jgi:hypothetical protein
MNCGPSAAPRRLEYVTTAHQAGPVGFRDPLGAVSPDGVWVAFISDRHLFLHRIQSATKELLPADNPKRAIAWVRAKVVTFQRNNSWRLFPSLRSNESDPRT